jgi:hypothetical protein
MMVAWIAACSNPAEDQQKRESLLNEQRIQALKRGNDSLTQTREVIFWSRFDRTEDLDCFKQYLGTNAFEVLYVSERKTEPHPHVVEFGKSLIPSLALMNTLTLELIAASHACKGFYTEWEAPVVP